jgi:endonuclease YncB( thermonuclease family)
MKKKMKIYEQPTVKVVRFMVEQGFAGTYGGDNEGTGGEDGEEEIELLGRKSSIWEKNKTSGFGNGGSWDRSF